MYNALLSNSHRLAESPIAEVFNLTILSVGDINRNAQLLRSLGLKYFRAQENGSRYHNINGKGFWYVGYIPNTT